MSSPVVPSVVSRCARRRDGAWLVLTRTGISAVADEELPEGTNVLITEGRAYRATRPD